MSQHPPTPSMGGPPTYTQQWCPSHLLSSTTRPSSLPPALPFNQDPPSAQQPLHSASQPFNFNDMSTLNPSPSLPGLGVPGTGVPLPPPPFPFMNPFTPTQFPPPFPPIPMAALRYPSMPMPAANSHAQSRPSSGDLHSQANTVPLNAADSRAVTALSTDQDHDREEGELTDKEGLVTKESKPGGLSVARTDTRPPISMHQPVNGPSSPNAKLTSMSKEFTGDSAVGKRSASISSLEEGEASSTETHRESESPYNPPASVTAEPSVSNRGVASGAAPLKNVSSPSSKTPQTTRGGGKPLAQLRIQAQGALLSLAPHNIRYSELVGEGINPSVLKQLYEEVGIKVITPQPGDVAPANKPLLKPPGLPENAAGVQADSRLSGSLESQRAAEVLDQARRQPDVPVAAAGTNLSSSVPIPPQSTTAAKPLERKEVIARMLAAKAAKALGTSSAPRGESAKEVLLSESQVSTPVEKAVAVSSEHEAPAKEKEVRIREKNKAQTELARQRMEQLKKQGLMRSQQKTQTDSSPCEETRPSNGTNPASVLQPSNTPMIQHPLPNRPPEPGSTATARIPGLFMTESEPSVTRVRGLMVDSTPRPHVSQRKRPRASDFDEPSLAPKRSYNGVNPSEDRLIIDISDDEFYGDNEDEMEIETLGNTPLEADTMGPEGSVRPFPPSTDFLPQRPASQAISTSTTPQSFRNHEQEDLRKRDLEIQAMHRRIAELEQRKKAKLAVGQTQSPLVSDLAVSSPSAKPISAEHNIRPIADTPPEPVNPKVPPPVAIVQAASEAIPPVPPVDSGIFRNLSPVSIARISAIVDSKHLEGMRSKLLRKKEIESGIPALDAEIQNYESRLADFKREAELLSHDIAKGKEGRQQLLEELRNLDLELNGLTFEELEVAQRKLESEEQAQIADEVSTRHQTPRDEHGSLLPDSIAAEPPSQDEARFVQESAAAHLSPPSEASLPSHLAMEVGESHDAVESANDISPVSSMDSPGSAMDESVSASDESVFADQGEPMDCEMPDQEPPATQTPESVSLKPQALASESEVDHVLPEPLCIPNATAQEYAVPDTGEKIEELEDQASRESSVSEAYEPPEPEADKSDTDSAYTPRFSSVSPGPVETMMISENPNADVSLMGEFQELDVRPPAVPQEIGLLDIKPPTEDTAPKFTPYMSPLGYFKAYRYHPKFTENVSGGFRSLTYSHNIDPMKYLCPYEATGGVCNDRSCEFQHFRDMTLSDDKILVQMGSLREGKTPEEKDQYIAGLKEIINEMRRDKVKDFNTVATEIAAYRRRFLQDPSRVLPL